MMETGFWFHSFNGVVLPKKRKLENEERAFQKRVEKRRAKKKRKR